MDNKQTVFLFTDVQVVEESFLEDINNVLSSGEVPGLYKPDEFEEVSALRREVCYGGSVLGRGVCGPKRWMCYE